MNDILRRLISWASPAEQLVNAHIIYGFFSPTMILGPSGAVAAVVNASAESMLTQTVSGDGGHAYALWQLHEDRISAILQHTGINIASDPAPSVLEQCHAIWWEMSYSERKARAALREAATPEAATAAWCTLFERPLNTAYRSSQRVAMVAGWEKKLGLAA